METHHPRSTFTVWPAVINTRGESARLIDSLFYEVTGVINALCRRMMCWVSYADEKSLEILRQQMEAELIYERFNEDETGVSDLSSSDAPL
ncbi:hypothetical protein QQF64_031169 [Cirrhinus molitorella]|uniref:Uncharacterized protein n=1 Tax=Cirrhinus molitorella TaxID=172907 RepID=A0ABR3N5Q3_9TELE